MPLNSCSASLALLLCAGFLPLGLWAQDESSSHANSDENQQEYREQLLAIAASYNLRLENDQENPQLLRQPLFSWSNPQRQSDGGALFLWTLKGRPIATIGIWKMEAPGRNGFEIQSLADQPVVGENRVLPRWNASQPAVEYQLISDAQQPAANARLRLRQMRQLAMKRFSAQIDPRVDGGEELRLIEKPLYRYQQVPDGVIDGAMFAFAQDTDPELLLVIEAREQSTSNPSGWYFAAAPATSHGIHANFDNQVVLDLERTTSSRENRTFQLFFWSAQMIESLADAERPH